MSRLTLLAALSLALLVPATAVAATSPVDLALEHVGKHAPASRADLADVVVRDRVVDTDTGTTHVYLQQRHRGIDVANAITNVSVAKDGRVLTRGDRFVVGLAGKAGGTLRQTAAEAAETAINAAGLPLRRSLRVRSGAKGLSRRTVFEKGESSTAPIPVELVYVRDGGAVRLAWQAVVAPPRSTDVLEVTIDAATGAVLDRNNRTVEAMYDVFALPTRSPGFGPRTTLTDPADAVASPHGWHDKDGAPGAETTLTDGNNAHVGVSRPDLEGIVPGTEADGGTALDFRFPLDLAAAPETYTDASVTQLFATSNRLHDILYRHGFDEDAGNFQVTNRTGEGVGGDPMVGLARANSFFFGPQANISVPPDGQAPRMRLGNLVKPRPTTVTVTAPYEAEYTPVRVYNEATAPVTAQVELVNDGVGNPHDGCEAWQDFTAGRIALVKRPIQCGFIAYSIQQAETAGATGMLVGGTDQTGIFATPLPVVGLQPADAAALDAALPATVTIATGEVPVGRDFVYDNEVVAHEYAHGLSLRLVGGPSTVSCLNTAEQPGEGWSDFVSLAVTASGASAADETQAPGTWIFDQGPDGLGVRYGPYSTDLSKSPWVYDDLEPGYGPHATGMRFAAALWEVYWQLVRKHGFEPDVSQDWTTGGNTLALRLAIDGMKMTPCNPGQVDARDAVLAADQNLTGGANQCEIWRGFAKRRLGASAQQGSPNSYADQTPASDLPEGVCEAAEVDPEELSMTAPAGGTAAAALDVGNAGPDAAPDLTWKLEEAATDCDQRGDVDWLGVASADGETAPGDATPVEVTADGAVATPGTHTAVLCLDSSDPIRPTIEIPVTLRAGSFSGFFGAFSSTGLNPAKSGAAVSMPFSLGGNFGLAVFAPLSPRSLPISCATRAPIGPAAPTTGPLTYTAETDRYTYAWKTTKAMKDTCRRIVLEFTDRTEKSLDVRFTK